MSSHRYSTPKRVETAFYQAFQRGDLHAMMAVWCDDDRIICIHPGGPQLRGREPVREGWRQILENSMGLEFTLTDVQVTGDEWLSVRVVREEISIEGQFSGSMLVTNIYQRAGRSWHMMLHHASPEPEPMYDELDMPYEDVVLH